MPRPPGALVVKWRDMAADGQSYAQIARRHPEYTADQVRHYCLGNTGRKLPGPLQETHRWAGHNVWLQGESSPHAELTRKQVLAILEDWDEEAGDWGSSGAEWARRLGVSASTIHMLRRGETWEHLKHPNQGRRQRERALGNGSRGALDEGKREPGVQTRALIGRQQGKGSAFAARASGIRALQGADGEG